MCDGQHSAVLEHSANSALHQRVRLDIHAGRGFVEYHHLAVPQQRTGHADKLALAVAPVLSTLRHGSIQLTRVLWQGHHLKSFRQLVVAVVVQRIQVAAEGARKQRCLLS